MENANPKVSAVVLVETYMWWSKEREGGDEKVDEVSEGARCHERCVSRVAEISAGVAVSRRQGIDKGTRPGTASSFLLTSNYTYVFTVTQTHKSRP